MKLRHGFVSNSSSSSFIIGLGVVKDVLDLKANVDNNLFILETVQNLKANKHWDLRVNDAKVSLEAFTSESVTLDISDLPDETLIMIMNLTGERDSDSDFYDGDYMDHDVPPTDSDAERMEIIHKYCTRGDVLFGAGRNG